MGFMPVIGRPPQYLQRCAFCNSKEPAPYQLSQEYIKELSGNPNRDCTHIKCLVQQQEKIRRFPIVTIALDQHESYFTGPYLSDNQFVAEDTVEGRSYIDGTSENCLVFFWQHRQFFIEPKRSAWLKEHTTYPRNFLISLADNNWWLYLPRNQALMYKLTWGGVIEDPILGWQTIG